MKRIELLVKGVTEEVKAKFKIQRINAALKSAKLNAEEELELAKSELQCLDAEKLNAEEIVTRISDALDRIECAETTLVRIKKIDAYLNTEA